MRFFVFLFLFFLSVGASAQRLDFEVINDCLIDEDASAKGDIRFKRVRMLNTGEIKDFTFDLTAEYTVTGTVAPCADLELLDAECYEVTGGEYCNYSLFFPSNGSPDQTRQVDSIFSNEIFVDLNYPYILRPNGSNDFDEYARLHEDLRAYLNNYGYFYESVGPVINIVNTNFPLTRSVQRTITDTGSNQVSVGQTPGSPSNCFTVAAQEIKLYRDETGDIEVIIDETGAVLTDLPTLRIKRVECDLELLDAECYEVRDTLASLCNTRLNIPFSASNPFNLTIGTFIDSVYFEGAFMPLQNYPYQTQPNSEIEQLMDDIEAFYVANNIPYTYRSGKVIYGTKQFLTRNNYRIERQNDNSNLGYNLTPFGCETQTDVSFFSLYRDVEGNVQTIVTPDGRTVELLPDEARKIECCEVCEVAAASGCQVRNKTRTVLLTDDSLTLPADTYYSVSAWHISGFFQFQPEGSGAVSFLESANFTLSDTSNDPCTYKQTGYTFSTNVQGNSGTALIIIHY